VSRRLTDLLGCELPIQLAPMGCVSVRTELARAVVAAGGHAVYPALTLPGAALTAQIEELPELGINFLVPMMERETLAAVAERARYVDFFLADPDAALVELARANGATVGWQLESGEEARAAEAAGCDLVIAKGWESGGRKRFEGPALLPLLEEILAAVNLPVIAAGGIATARGVAAALAAGADGVRVGTRFIAAAESDAHPKWIEAILHATANDAVVSVAFNADMPQPGPHRVLRSSIEAAEALAADDVGIVRLFGAEIPVTRFAPMPPSRESTGAIEAMPFYAGQSAGAVDAVRPAAEIMAELRSGLG
jgi:NAD(P)H-dependent flavin oxidoreductase YrpB (nitropropane dioxygenase family)